MRNDKYGRQVLSEEDLIRLFLVDPSRKIRNAWIDSDIQFDPSLELDNVPYLSQYIEEQLSIDDFDTKCQDNWFMPDEYKNMDIAKYVLDLCKTDYELQRVGEELLLYQDRGMFPLLCYCKYLVDTMRKYNIVWGVGRGSSVSSYVLYLLGVHRINSLHYDLSINEFLK